MDQAARANDLQQQVEDLQAEKAAALLALAAAQAYGRAQRELAQRANAKLREMRNLAIRHPSQPNLAYRAREARQ